MYCRDSLLMDPAARFTPSCPGRRRRRGSPPRRVAGNQTLVSAVGLSLAAKVKQAREERHGWGAAGAGGGVGEAVAAVFEPQQRTRTKGGRDACSGRRGGSVGRQVVISRLGRARLRQGPGPGPGRGQTRGPACAHQTEQRKRRRKKKGASDSEDVVCIRTHQGSAAAATGQDKTGARVGGG